MQDDVIPHAEAGDEQIAPVPRISLQAFCETAELASVIADAAEDRCKLRRFAEGLEGDARHRRDLLVAGLGMRDHVVLHGLSLRP